VHVIDSNSAEAWQFLKSRHEYGIDLIASTRSDGMLKTHIQNLICATAIWYASWYGGKHDILLRLAMHTLLL
jgi:hypothetical protein